MAEPSLIAALQAGKPLIFAHRGASAAAPMNTLAAFDLAHQQGADGIELDVRLTRDGEIVVIHDATVNATTDGRGAVADMTLAEIKRLDAGSWFGPEFAGERIPTLAEVFEAVGSKLFINVEIKEPPDESNGIEKAVAACIAQHELTRRVLVSSFSEEVLRRFERLEDVANREPPSFGEFIEGDLETLEDLEDLEDSDELEDSEDWFDTDDLDELGGAVLGYLHSQRLLPNTKALIPSFEFEAKHPWHRQVDRKYMQQAQEEDTFVIAWTVNSRERAQALRRLGVHAIITDKPALIRAALAR